MGGGEVRGVRGGGELAATGRARENVARYYEKHSYED